MVERYIQINKYSNKYTSVIIIANIYIYILLLLLLEVLFYFILKGYFFFQFMYFDLYSKNSMLIFTGLNWKMSILKTDFSGFGRRKWTLDFDLTGRYKA